MYYIFHAWYVGTCVCVHFFTASPAALVAVIRFNGHISNPNCNNDINNRNNKRQKSSESMNHRYIFEHKSLFTCKHTQCLFVMQFFVFISVIPYTHVFQAYFTLSHYSLVDTAYHINFHFCTIDFAVNQSIRFRSNEN